MNISYEIWRWNNLCWMVGFPAILRTNHKKNVSGMGNNSIAFEFTGETLHNGDINCNVQMQLHEDTN